MFAYAELAVTTNFSFLRGASTAEELVLQAKELGLIGIGVADRNSVAGVVRVHSMAKKIGLKVAVGARLVFSDGSPDILAYPEDRKAWGRLTRLLTVGKDRAEKGDCILGLPDLLEEIEGLNLIVMPPPRINVVALVQVLRRLKAMSRRGVWLGANVLYRGDDARRFAKLQEVADSAFVPLIAVNDVLYHAPERRPLQDVVTCIREHKTLEEAGRLLEANAERHLKSPAEMARLFGPASKSIGQTARFFKRCRFSLDELKPNYPSEFRHGYATAHDALVALTEEGAMRRYSSGLPPEIRETLDKELAVIKELDCAAYFLTVHDIVRHAESKNILCQGRGSAANSLVCYCLHITSVSPERAGLLFERFLSKERKGEPPDIDVDFEHERREEVIQYIYNHYKRRHAAMTATVICYRGRSAIRDVGKVFDLSKDAIDALAGSLWGWSMAGVTKEEALRIGLDAADPRLSQVLALSHELLDFPRHLSQHVGGFVISETRLDEIVPIENAAMEDRTVIEWDKDDLDVLNILKVDVLGLGMLSCLRRGFDLIAQHYGERCSLWGILENKEKAIYDMLSRADSIGVFQVESRAQMSMLPRLKPEKFYDLVVEVAIVRPGPIQGNMVHPYLRRKEGLDPVEIPSPSPQYGKAEELQEILGRTMGVPLFQEQAMRIAMVAAEFSAAEASRLRRSMGTFKRTGEVKVFKDRFIGRMCERGYPQKFVEDCFKQIEGFGEYGFPESHAASFALLVYVSAWIKCHYPDVFLAALLNSQPMGFYATAQLVRDAQEHGVEVRPVDINASNWDCSLEAAPLQQLHARHGEMKDDIRTAYAVRLGFREIDGFAEDWAETIENLRGEGFDSVRDLWLRTGLPPKALQRLAHADAFNSLGLSRRDALWAVKALQKTGDKDDLPLFARVAMPALEPDANLPSMLPGQQVIEDYRHLRLSLKAHPISFLRRDFEARGILQHDRLSALAPGRRVTIGGLVLVRQRPGTGNAIFMTLEDETAIANTIVWPRKFEEYRPVVMGSRVISVTGVLQNAKGVIHIVADRFEDLTHLLARLSEHGASIDPAMPPDELKRPVYSRQRHPRSGDALVTMLKERPGIGSVSVAQQSAQVMPKGRNFH